MNWVDPWELSASDGQKNNQYQEGVTVTHIPYGQWTPLEGEGLLGMYSFDVYTSIKKDSDIYQMDVWAIAVSGPHIQHEDTQYFGAVSLNADGKEKESKFLHYPQDSFLIGSFSAMVGETQFQLPQHGDVSITIKKTGYVYSNSGGKQFSYPSHNVTIDIKEQQ